jgi:hypothetical protein
MVKGGKGSKFGLVKAVIVGVVLDVVGRVGRVFELTVSGVLA